MPQAKTVVDLKKPITHAAFAALVGISRPAISELQARGVLVDGEAAGTWLIAYCRQLREAAAGRGAENPLSRERARLAAIQADRAERSAAIERGEYAPVALLETALATVARLWATKLEALVPLVRRKLPALPAPALRLIEQEIINARAAAAAVTLASAAAAGDEDDESGQGAVSA